MLHTVCLQEVKTLCQTKCRAICLHCTTPKRLGNNNSSRGNTQPIQDATGSIINVNAVPATAASFADQQVVEVINHVN
jgi:hypothetical protein